MKKLWTITMAVLLIFCACDNGLLPSPSLPPQDGNARGVAPSNISASHGEKRSITIQWDPVEGATSYRIYSAGDLDKPFEQCGVATSSTRFKDDSASSGSIIYYRVSSVSSNGSESTKSAPVKGTALAEPVISEINDTSEDMAVVEWYMENVSKNTYEDNLLYSINCYNESISSSNPVAQIVLEAWNITENKVVFTNLSANTPYLFEVEAYLSTNQSASEKSKKMDAKTARRQRPGKPENLSAARGTSVDKVKLTFELPDWVEVALGEDKWEQKPLYFTISKRKYREGGNNEFQVICDYFGIDEYKPGNEVEWTDNNVDREETYEYQVQSYVDKHNKLITSDSSRNNTTGWAISNGKVSYGILDYTYNSDGTLYSNVKLPVSFEFDPKGETYNYEVKANVEKIGDDYANDPTSKYSLASRSIDLDTAKNFAFEMDLERPSSSTTPGRGIYSVEVAVSLPGGTTPITTFKALGSLQISEDTQPIVVENFSIRDGYKDRFVLIWDKYANRKYTIEQSETGEEPWTPIKSVNNDSTDDNDKTVIQSYEYEITGYNADETRYFRIRPEREISASKFKSGQPVYVSAAQTLGIPKLSLDGKASYSLITPLWKETQKADTYRIKYRYTDEGAAYKTAGEVKKEELNTDAEGNFRYSFNPEGYNDAQKAGKEIQVVVDALNEGLQKAFGGSEISTTSTEDVRTRLVGPALLNTDVSKAASTQEISVSWSPMTGANGYYVFRRQFNMNNTTAQGNDAIVYYVPKSDSSSINIIGKELALDSINSKTDTLAGGVKAAASFANSRYTLKDMHLPDTEYNSASYSSHSQNYKDQQNDMVQGMSYRYFIVPVITDTLSAVNFSYNKDNLTGSDTSIASYSIQENGFDIIYSAAASLEKEGFLIGFGQSVAATKGTYSSSTTDGRKNNNGIEIKWTAPPCLASVSGFSPRYTVYRRESGGSSWTPVIKDYASTSYVDTTADAGKAYEYTIGINNASGGNTSSPQSSRRFIESCIAQRDEKNRPNMSGYKLGMVKMDSVSRGADAAVNAQYGEVVKWLGAGISSTYNSDSNWGIDGYEVFVMNRNIDANWHSINSMTSVPNQVSLSVTLTPNNTPSATVSDGLGTTTRNLLYVLRDYKHYFKVRSFVMNGDERIYSPDPAYTYTNGTASNPYFLETDYVKWGARQITQKEFAQITSLYMARAIQQADYWTSTWAVVARTWRTVNAATNYGGGGSMRHSSNAGVTEWWYEYRNWKTDLETRAGDWMTFISVDGDVWIVTDGWSSTKPYRYRRANNGYKNNRLVVTGPSDTPYLYSGEVQFGANNADNNANNLRYNDGTVHVIYPKDTPIQTFSLAGKDTALIFSTDVGGTSSYDNQGNNWR